MCEKIMQSILQNKLIVIVRNVEKDKMIPLAEALYAGGIRLMEVTYCADGRIPHRETAESIGMLTEHFQGKMAIGAGTVLTPEQVEQTKQAGGTFIISPDVNGAVIAKTKELGLVSIPGALTPSEIRQAHDFGADFVKVFPAGSMGADYIRAVAAPLSHIKLLAVGGICDTDMAEYSAAGVCGFGIGSALIKKQYLADNNWEAITEMAKTYTAVIR